MPFGVNKAVLFGAAGSGGESGWVVEPTSSSWGTTGRNVDGIALDADNNVWGNVKNTNNERYPLFQVLADGTAGAANNWKEMSNAQQGGASQARDVIYTGSGGSYPNCVVASGAMNRINSKWSVAMSKHTPGTLVQDWDNGVSQSNGSYDSFAYIGCSTHKPGENHFYVTYYWYDWSQNRYSSAMQRISLADGSQQNISTSQQGFYFYRNYGETWYPSHPFITNDSSGNQWVFMALRSSNSGYTGFAGVRPQATSGTTQFRYMYQVSSGSNSGVSGGFAEASSTHMYFTSGCKATNTLHLLKVNKTTGAIDWQRRISPTNNANVLSVCNPVVDSSGNVYVAWTQYDSNNIVDTAYRLNWAMYNSSGTLQTIAGSQMRSLFLSPGDSGTTNNPAYASKMVLSSDDKFLYICGKMDSPSNGYIAKLPTDGSGTGTTSLSGNTDSTYHYRDDVPVSETAGNYTAAGQIGNTNFFSGYQMTNPVNNATAVTPIILSDELH